VTKEWIAEHSGHRIRVQNTWFSGARLYIDGECRDTNQQFFAVSGAMPRLSARLVDSEGQTHVIEVFIKAPLFTVKTKICVDGRQIGGDVF
jgi:hypothetical protein